MLRASRSPREYIGVARSFRCAACETTKRKPSTPKVSPPKPYEFNREVGVGVFEIKDAIGARLDVLNA
eukprot:11182381-Lingulodinium_polyedra.AAC.1